MKTKAEDRHFYMCRNFNSHESFFKEINAIKEKINKETMGND